MYRPVKLSLVYKDYLWGGTKLGSKYGKQSETNIIAESWELSVHKDGQSCIASGPYSDCILEDYIEEQVTGVKRDEKEMSEDTKAFFDEYYPELHQELDKVSIELKRDDIEEFLALLPPIFDAGFAEPQLQIIIKLAEELVSGDMNRTVFYPRFQEKRMTVAVEIKRLKGTKSKLEFSAVTELANAIDRQMALSCE